MKITLQYAFFSGLYAEIYKKILVTYRNTSSRDGLLSICYQSYGNLITLIKQTGFLLLICGCVNITVWMHHIDANKSY